MQQCNAGSTRASCEICWTNDRLCCSLMWVLNSLLLVTLAKTAGGRVYIMAQSLMHGVTLVHGYTYVCEILSMTDTTHTTAMCFCIPSLFCTLHGDCSERTEVGVVD